MVSVGCWGVAQGTLDRVILGAGQPAATARAMFDSSVVPVFIVAAGIAAAVTLLLGVRGQWRRVTVAGRFMGDPRWREPGGYRGGLVDAAWREQPAAEQARGHPWLPGAPGDLFPQRAKVTQVQGHPRRLAQAR